MRWARLSQIQKIWLRGVKVGALQGTAVPYRQTVGRIQYKYLLYVEIKPEINTDVG